MDIETFSQTLSQDVKRTTTTNVIADKLSFMIESGLLKVGDSLPSERDLAKTLGVARMTVRNAIHVLAAKGFVEMSQGARTKVVRQEGQGLPSAVALTINLADRDLQSAYEARRMLEREIVGDVARSIDDKTIARLEALVAEQTGMFEDVAAFQISDREFHETIYRAGRNSLLCDMALGLYNYGLGLRRSALSVPGAIKRSHTDHQLIVSALAHHDEQEAVQWADIHLTNILATTADAMKSSIADAT